MLFIKDKTIKVGGKYLPCEVVNVKIDEDGVIDDVEDEKGKKKKNQSVGYDPFKMTVSVNFMKTKSHTVAENIEIVQRLFKTKKQEKPKMMRVVNKHAAARGITKAFFSKFSTSQDIGKEIIPGTLEFTTERTTKVLVTKKKKSNKKSDTKSKAKPKKTSNHKTKKNMRLTAARDKKKTKSLVRKAAQIIRLDEPGRGWQQ